MVRIVRAGPEHLPEIMEIERASFPDPWSETNVRYELECPDTSFFAAVEDRVLGFAILRRLGSEAELFNIAVRFDERGRGIGRALLDRVTADAARRGVEKIYLEVRKSNEAALGLYRSMGFAVCGVRRNYYDCPREDAVLMDLDVPREQ